MPATDDEIREKYLERAIRELNTFTRDLQACDGCPRGQLMPVLGSGHPQADIMLLKHAPMPPEIEEGVAFYGRAGAGSDSHVAQGLGSVRVRMADFDGPEEFLESLREAEITTKPSSLLYVQALKFLETKATPPAARAARRERRVRRATRKS